MASVEELKRRQLLARQKLAREKLQQEAAPAAQPLAFRGVPQPDGSVTATVPLTPEARSAAMAGRGPASPVVGEPAPDLGVAEPSMATAALRGGSRQMLDNLLAVPEAMVNIPARAFYEAISPLTGGYRPPDFDMPSAAEVTAGAQTALNTPSALLSGGPGVAERYGNALERQQNVDIRFREAAPASTAVGEIGGDIATILATRGMGRAALTGTAAPARALPAAEKAASPVGSVIGNTLKSFANTAGKTAGRAAQAGAEAGLLATLQNADPAEVTAIASGGQLVSEIAKGTYKKLAGSPAKLLGTIAVAASAGLAIEQWTPGGLDRVLPTLEDANKHVWLTLVLSGLSSLPARQPGAALRASELASERVLGDLLGAVPRSLMESTVVWAVNNPAKAGPILSKFAEDPDYFGPKAQRMLVRAMTTEGADIDATVDSLLDDRAFRRKYEALTSPPAQ